MKKIIAIVLLQSLFAVLARADVEDAELRHILERAVRYEDNPHAAVSEIRYVKVGKRGRDYPAIRSISLLRPIMENPHSDCEAR